MAFNSQSLRGFAAAKSGVSKRKKRKIFEGGFFSDALDVLSIPQFAVGGALSGEGVMSGIKNRTFASDAIKIQNPWAAFAIDVALDPLTYLGGVGAATKVGKVANMGLKSVNELPALVKAGKISKSTAAKIKANPQLLQKGATVAEKFRRGQIAALTLDVPFVKSMQGIPLHLTGGKASKAIFEGSTLGTEYLKQFSKKWGVDLGEVTSKLGGRKTMSNVFTKGKLDLQKIEKVARSADDITQSLKAQKRAQRVFQGEANKITQKINNRLSGLKKLGKIDENDVKNLVRKMYDDAVEIPKVLDDVFVEARDLATKGLNWERAGGTQIAGKILPNVAKNVDKGKNKLLLGAREFGSESVSSKLMEFSGFKNLRGTTLAGSALNGSRAKLANGQDLVHLGSGLYTTKAVHEAVKNGQKKLPAMIADLEKKLKRVRKTEVTADIMGQIEQLKVLKKVQSSLDMDSLQAVAPELFFNRVALDPQKSTQVAKLMGRDNIEFSEDLIELLQVKTQRVAKQRAATMFVDEMKKFGKEIGKKGKVPDGYARSTLPELKGHVFREEVIGHIDNTFMNFKNLEGVGQFIKTFDEVQNLWKSTATIFNFAFHTRNFVSNMWQLHLAGARSIDDFARGLKMLTATRGGKLPHQVLKGDDLRHFTEFVSEGLGRSGSFSLDIEGSLSKKLHNTSLGRFFGGMGEGIEDYSKLVLYLDRRKKGFSVKAAADEVRKYLFDYSDLTNFERSWMKRIIPFYTWTRKNLPLQAAMLIQNPAKFADLSRFQNALQQNIEGKPLPEEYMPNWLQEAFPLFVGTSDDGMAQYLKLEGFIPAIDLNRMSRPGELFLEGATPVIKTPLEMISNYSFFFERDIEQFEGQRNKFLGFHIPAKTEYLLGQIRPLQEMNKLFALGNTEEYPAAKKRLVNFLIGKSYDMSLSQQKSIFQYVQHLQAQDVKKDLQKALTKGDTGEAQRLQELLVDINNGDYIHL